MNGHTLTVYTSVLSVLLLCSGAWLVTRGRKVGYFFATVALMALVSTVLRGAL